MKMHLLAADDVDDDVGVAVRRQIQPPILLIKTSKNRQTPKRPDRSMNRMKNLPKSNRQTTIRTKIEKFAVPVDAVDVVLVGPKQPPFPKSILMTTRNHQATKTVTKNKTKCWPETSIPNRMIPTKRSSFPSATKGFQPGKKRFHTS